MNELPEPILEVAQRLTDEASALWNAGSYSRTEALCREALELTRAALGDQDRRVAERLYNLAGLYYFQRRYEEAKSLYREAIRIQELQSWIDHPALAFCYAWMAKTQFEGWRDDPGVDGDDEGRSFDEAESCCRKALALLKRAGDDASPEYARCLLQLGFLYYYCDRAAEAEPLFLEALSLREAIFGPDHLETAEPIGRLAILYWQTANSQVDPEPLLRRALAIRQDQLDAGDPDVWEWTYRLAEFLSATGRREEADALYLRLGTLLLDAANPLRDGADWIVAGYLDYLFDTGQTAQTAAIEARWCTEPSSLRLKRQELNRRETMFGLDHPRVADSLGALADDLRFNERYDEALSLYRRALTIIEGAEGCATPALLPILNGIAMLFRAQDDMISADEILVCACSIPINLAATAESLQHARAIEQLAWVRSVLEGGEAAEALFCRAITLVESVSPCDNREVAEMRYRLSIFLAQEGRFIEAEENIVAALRTAEKTTDMDELEIADYREQYAVILAELDVPVQAAVQLAEVKRIWRESGAPRDDL